MSVPFLRRRLRALTVLLVPAVVVSGLVVTSTAHAQRITPDFWGMHDNDWSTAPDVPVGSANLTTSGTYWPNVETSEGTYDFTRLDTQVAAAEAKGAQPMIVLGFSPEFHSTGPAGSDARTFMPDLDAWWLYVSAVADRYGSRLDYQIWPEPNIKENWQGTPGQMAELTRVAANAINANLSAAEQQTVKIVSPALALRLPGQQAWMVDYFKQTVGGKRVHTYLDAIALDPFPRLEGTPEDSFALMQRARQRLARIGVRTPLWNNEINYGVVGANQPTSIQYPDAQSRSLVIRTYALSAAAGMQRTYWLGWFRSNTLGVQMTDESGSRAAAGEAYAVARSWMDGTSFQGCRTSTRGKTKGLRTCTMRESRREVRRIYWKTGGPVRIRVHETSRAFENQNGARRSKRGAFVLRVTSQPVMVVSRR